MKNILLCLVALLSFNSNAFSLDFVTREMPFKTLERAFQEAQPAKLDQVANTGPYRTIDWIDKEDVKVSVREGDVYLILTTIAKLTHHPARNDGGPLFPKKEKETVVDKIYAQVLLPQSNETFTLVDASDYPPHIHPEKMPKGVHMHENEDGLIVSINSYIYKDPTYKGIDIERNKVTTSYRVSQNNEIIVKKVIENQVGDTNEYKVSSVYYFYYW